jgi:hypothetical protein
MTKTPLKHSLTFTRSWQIDYFMKKILIDLQKLSLVLLTVLFFSCENPSDIGFDFDGNANATAVFTDTLSIYKPAKKYCSGNSKCGTNGWC